ALWPSGFGLIPVRIDFKTRTKQGGSASAFLSRLATAARFLRTRRSIEEGHALLHLFNGLLAVFDDLGRLVGRFLRTVQLIVQLLELVQDLVGVRHGSQSMAETGIPCGFRSPSR